MNKGESTILYYREGSSDKVYHASIEPAAGNLFLVNFAFGRRGTTLNTGTKTHAPVSFDAARAIYDKLLRDKKAKGYTEGDTGTPYGAARISGEHTGIIPQLLNPIREEELDQFIENESWCMQEKLDGKRVLIHKEGASITGINRRGLAIGLPAPLVNELAALAVNFLLDGEAIGDRYYAFDLLQLGENDLRTCPYRLRLSDLVRLIGFGTLRCAQTVPSYVASDQKRSFLVQAKALKKEGMVFKHLEAAYTAGRPSSGGAQLKYKFYATLSAKVAKLNAGRSVELALKGAEGWHSCGNVTIPANHAIPVPGQIVEVRYYPEFRIMPSGLGHSSESL